MANIRDMAEAHLQNVQQQLSELQNQKVRIEVDMQKLSDYLQHGVAELNEDGSSPLDSVKEGVDIDDDQ